MSDQPRRSYFRVADPNLQKDLLRFLGLFWGIWFILQNILIYMVLSGNALEAHDSQGRAVFIITSSIVFSCALFIAAIFLFNRLLQRIVGPIYRMKSDVDNYVSGQGSGPTRIRKSDYFQDFADSLNKAFLLVEDGSKNKNEKKSS